MDNKTYIDEKNGPLGLWQTIYCQSTMDYPDVFVSMRIGHLFKTKEDASNDFRNWINTKDWHHNPFSVEKPMEKADSILDYLKKVHKNTSEFDYKFRLVAH